MGGPHQPREPHGSHSELARQVLVREARARTSELLAQRRMLDAACADLASELERTEAEVLSAGKERAELAEAVQAKERQIGEMDEEIQKLELELGAGRRRENELELRASQLEEDNATARKLLGEIRLEISAAHTAMEADQRTIARVQRRISLRGSATDVVEEFDNGPDEFDWLSGEEV